MRPVALAALGALMGALAAVAATGYRWAITEQADSFPPICYSPASVVPCESDWVQRLWLTVPLGAMAGAVVVALAVMVTQRLRSTER